MQRAGKLTKAFHCVSLCALGLTIGGTVAFADGMSRGSSKDAPMQKSWQGFYIGTHAGLATGDTQGDSPGVVTNFDMAGSLAGAQIGYNWPRGIHVLGIEGGYAFSTVQGNTRCTVVLDCRREV